MEGSKGPEGPEGSEGSEGSVELKGKLNFFRAHFK